MTPRTWRHRPPGGVRRRASAAAILALLSLVGGCRDLAWNVRELAVDALPVRDETAALTRQVALAVLRDADRAYVTYEQHLADLRSMAIATREGGGSARGDAARRQAIVRGEETLRRHRTNFAEALRQMAPLGGLQSPVDSLGAALARIEITYRLIADFGVCGTSRRGCGDLKWNVVGMEAVEAVMQDEWRATLAYRRARDRLGDAMLRRGTTLPSLGE